MANVHCVNKIIAITYFEYHCHLFHKTVICAWYNNNFNTVSANIPNFHKADLFRNNSTFFLLNNREMQMK